MTELFDSMGFLSTISPLYTIGGAVIILLIMGYQGARLWVWTIFGLALLWGFAAVQWLWIVFGIIAVVFNIPIIRSYLITLPIQKIISAGGFMPTISETERIALEAGTTWIEDEFFSGKPNFKRIMSEYYPELSEKEKAFLDGPVEEVCGMVTEWEIHEQQDLPFEVWNYLKQERFFGMVIPEQYGGLGFSATGMNAIIAKLSSHSTPLSVDVMVPNSLGPAELLIHYGTDEQKEYYLPRLAIGEEIPCFALTEANAGSDAASITSYGEVFEGKDGELYLRLNWKKRYITLAAVSTVLGLAFQLKDPENLLGKGEKPGITCGLIPTDTPGVKIGQRHNPVGVPFINSPTEGKDVVVPIGQIIGGPSEAGNGWKMLMETLAGGRGIFLPALSNGGSKLASRVVSAYAAVRQQFAIPIGRFEGIEEKLAPIGAFTYLLEALSRFTCGAVDQGKKPAVISAIAKYQSSEFNRFLINDAMDILGGAGIMLGPKNILGFKYIAAPIAITVEGANILTRTLIIFGQGLIRCHPYVLTELKTLESGDLRGFDKAFWGHGGMIIRNKVRTLLLNLTRGYLAAPFSFGPTANYYRKLYWATATFAFMSDLALFSLGGSLKVKEKLSGRFADVLSWLYLSTCVLRKYEARGRKKQDLPFVHWNMKYSEFQIQQAFEGLYSNFPFPLGLFFRGPAAWWARLNPIGKKPSDNDGKKVARMIQQPGEIRDHLTNGIYLPENLERSIARLENAFVLNQDAQPLIKRIKIAVKKRILQKAKPIELVKNALEEGVINQMEYDLLNQAEEARAEAVKVDSFNLEELPVQINAGSGSSPGIIGRVMRTFKR